ncbi:MAG: hypothetical protein ACRDHP_07900 [Ktedonobacterales bacterium]
MRRRRWPALRWGGLGGGVAAALVGVHEALTNTILPNTLAVGLLAGVGFFLLYLALFFAAGALAAHETGRVGAGTRAGVFAALIAGAVSLILGVLDTVRQPGAGAPPPGAKIAPGLYLLELVAISAGVYLLVLVLFLAFGAGFGALGGVAGRPIPATPQAEASSPATKDIMKDASDQGIAPPDGIAPDAATIASVSAGGAGVEAEIEPPMREG